MLCIFAFSCNNNRDDFQERKSILFSAIQQEADIVTTEVTIRKIAIFNSEKNEKISLRDPATWKIGSRKCIVPVDVTIKYGYDVRDIKIESIRIDDSSKIVHIKLPKAKVIDSSYSPDDNPDNIICISTGLRSAVGHEIIESVSKKAYDEIMKKKEFTEIAEKDVRNNVKMVFGSIAKSLGYKDIEIE